MTDLVNLAISNKFLYGLMKIGAKRQLKSTAEARGVAWDANIAELQSQMQLLEQIKGELEDSNVQYPEYYLKPFHAYEKGNLEWMAAFEVEPATQSIYVNCWKEEKTLTPETAGRRLRGAVTDAIQDFQRQHGARPARDILDVGCSVGVSTRWLAQEFSAASVVGLDLSPYFLAVAELRERQHEQQQQQQQAAGRPRIRYMHALGEATGLPDSSQDLVALQFVIHECPPAAIGDLVAEARRLLRPGGVLLLSDNDPRSKVIQSLPPAIFTLMKSTEPHSDVYYTFDVERCMRDHGFAHVVTQQTDPRHRAVLGLKV